ncbi:MAG: RES domain-containing protein [Longimicrobiales bacterium]
MYRVHNRRYDPLDAGGAAIVGGRWNPVGSLVVYACRTFEGALLEQLVHAGTGRLPKNRIAAAIRLPKDVEVPLLDLSAHAQWRRESVSQQIGKEWLSGGESLAIQVPSIVAQPWGWNILLNPRHPDFGRVAVVDSAEVAWDPRFGMSVR